MHVAYNTLKSLLFLFPKSSWKCCLNQDKWDESIVIEVYNIIELNTHAK